MGSGKSLCLWGFLGIDAALGSVYYVLCGDCTLRKEGCKARQF